MGWICAVWPQLWLDPIAMITNPVYGGAEPR